MENNIITNKELYFHYAKELGISNKDAIVLLKLALAGFGKEIKDLPNTEYYQPLFNLMSEHNLTLLEGEMDEIIDCVLKMVESSKTKLTSERNYTKPFINEIIIKTSACCCKNRSSFYRDKEDNNICYNCDLPVSE